MEVYIISSGKLLQPAYNRLKDLCCYVAQRLSHNY